MIAWNRKIDRNVIPIERFLKQISIDDRRETEEFNFDRVFSPQSTQSDVFKEITQLVQVCVAMVNYVQDEDVHQCPTNETLGGTLL